uniref:Fibulin 2 n=1 Tax=Latimeria chalumnae TaxID=7897 RepID=H3A9E2_LATCH
FVPPGTFLLLFLGLLALDSQAQRDCTGVECPLLEKCIEEVLQPGACCSTCVQRGCTCEGYQYYDCLHSGYRNGKVPAGASYLVDYGSTECKCPEEGGQIACQFIPCPELPKNCIEVAHPADRCPECTRVGCQSNGKKYAEGHSFLVEPCTICHCLESGALMCTPSSDCEGLRTGSKEAAPTLGGNKLKTTPATPTPTRQGGPAGNRRITRPHSTPPQPAKESNQLPKTEGRKGRERAGFSFFYLVCSSSSEFKKKKKKKKKGGRKKKSIRPAVQLTIHTADVLSNLKTVSSRAGGAGNVSQADPSSAVSGGAHRPGGASSRVRTPFTLKQSSDKQVTPSAQTGKRGSGFGHCTTHHEKGKNQQNYQSKSVKENVFKRSLDTCCATGRRWASENTNCSHIPMRGRDTDACRSAREQCCLSSVEEQRCLSGILAATQEGSCKNQVQETCRGGTYKRCCECCTLGLKAQSLGLSCDEIPPLGLSCGQAFVTCCKGGGNLGSILPGSRREPRRPQEIPNTDLTDAAHQGQTPGTESRGGGRDNSISTLLPGPHCTGTVDLSTTGSRYCPTLPVQDQDSPCKNSGSEPAMRWREFPDLQKDFTSLSENPNPIQNSRAPCKSHNPCMQVCQGVGQSTRCSCHSGYRLLPDGTSCEDVDECKQGGHTCTPTQWCLNSIGSFRCVKHSEICDEGFAPNHAGDCEDIDECSQGRHNCRADSECQNVPGSFFCRPRCGMGFTPGPQGHCVDMNECIQGSHNCGLDSDCHNTRGSFVCRPRPRCRVGFTREHQGKCIDVDECQTGTHRCGERQLCKNAPGSYRCDCPRGYQAEAITRTCVDVNECLRYPGRICAQHCENVPGSYHCTCGFGYNLAADGRNCEDVNECESSPCSQECVNMYGSYQCYCRQGFVLSQVDRTTCEDVDECEINGVSLCSFRCVNTPGSFKCACPEQGYTLMVNGRNCKDVDECTLGIHNCSLAETCYNIQGGYRCLSFECPSNYRRAAENRCERISCSDYVECQMVPQRITYYQLTFPSNIRVPANIFRIGPSPIYAGDNVLLTITRGNEGNYFSTRRANNYSGYVYLQVPPHEPMDFLLDVEMTLIRRGTATKFVAKIYVFITGPSL